MLITPKNTRASILASWILKRASFAMVVFLVVILINFIGIVHYVTNAHLLLHIYIPADEWRSTLLSGFGLEWQGSWWKVFWQYLRNCLTFNFGDPWYSHY